MPESRICSPFTPPHPSLYMCYTVWTTENWLKTIEQTSSGASSSGPSSSCWPANQTLWRLTRSPKGQPQQSQVTAAVSEKSIRDPEIPGTDLTMGNDVEGEVKPPTLADSGPTVFVKKGAVQTQTVSSCCDSLHVHIDPHLWQDFDTTIWDVQQ